MQTIKVKFTMAAAIACLLATAVYAQPPQFGGRDGGRGPAGRGPNSRGPADMSRMLPLMKAIDANGDGEISAEEMKNASKALAALDKDEDGKLSAQELRPEFPGGGERAFGQPQLGISGRQQGSFGIGPPPSAEENIARWLAMDKNKDGKLSKDEIPERMQGLLTRLDADKDGSLSKEELKKGAEHLRGPEEKDTGGGAPNMADRIFEENDANKDGKLTGDEIPGRMKESLDRIDKNKDGAIEKKELEALSQFFQGARGAFGRGPGFGQGPGFGPGPGFGGGPGGPRGGGRPTDRPQRPEAD